MCAPVKGVRAIVRNPLDVQVEGASNSRRDEPLRWAAPPSLHSLVKGASTNSDLVRGASSVIDRGTS